MERDYTLILDKSGSMSRSDEGGKTRWELMQESTLAIASKCEKLDPDGITIYLFSGNFRRYENTTAAKVAAIFDENEPMGGTNLTSVLKDAIDRHFSNPNAKPETIIIVTDGEPDDRKSVMQVIIDATGKMKSDEELALLFIQCGKDAGAKEFLVALDDKLQGVGAKFDICDTKTMDDLGDMTITEVLEAAISD